MHFFGFYAILWFLSDFFCYLKQALSTFTVSVFCAANKSLFFSLLNYAVCSLRIDEIKISNEYLSY